MRNVKQIKIHILYFMLISCIVQVALCNSVEELSKQITERMSKVRTISFSFQQNTFIADSTQTIKAEVFFKRPDNLKIIYQKPHIQEIYFSDGYLFTYIPEIKQATKQKSNNFIDMLGVTTSVILSSDSFGLLKKNFKLSVNENRKNGKSIRTVPILSTEYNFDNMIIFFNTDTYLPEETVVYAPNFKSVTIFTNYILNPVLNDDCFSFKAGNDVNILDFE